MTTLPMFESEIRAANPWWIDPAAIDRDPAILSAERSIVKRVHGGQYRFAAGDHVYTLRGPRRVGKTTLLMMEVRRLLGEGVQPQDVLYYSFETEGRPADIYMLVTEYLAMSGGRGSSRRFIFLDEVTGIRHWDKGVKKLLDRGSLRNCTVVATGSHAADVAISAAQAVRAQGGARVRRLGPGAAPHGLWGVRRGPRRVGAHPDARPVP